MKTYYLFICLALFISSCHTKKHPVKELSADSTVKKEKAYVAENVDIEYYSHSNPVYTSDIINEGIRLKGNQLKRFVPEYKPESLYYHLGTVEMVLLRGHLIQENTARSKSIYLVVTNRTGNKIEYKMLLHLQNDGEIIYKSILGGVITEITARYHFGEVNNMEIFNNYVYIDTSSDPLNVAPLLQNEKGIVTGKKAMAALLQKLNMNENWIRVSKEYTGTYPAFIGDAKKWVISACQSFFGEGTETIFITTAEESPYQRNNAAKYIPLYLYSHHDTYLYEIISIIYYDYGNRLIINLKLADQILWYGPGENRFSRVEYRYMPEAGVRKTIYTGFDYVLTYRAKNILDDSPKECEPGPK